MANKKNIFGIIVFGIIFTGFVTSQENMEKTYDALSEDAVIIEFSQNDIEDFRQENGLSSVDLNTIALSITRLSYPDADAVRIVKIQGSRTPGIYKLSVIPIKYN